MNRTVPLCLFLAAAFGAGNALAQQALVPDAAPSADELAFRHQLMLDGYARVEYRDEAGNPITFSDILQAIPRGKSFSIDKDSSHTLATVRLDGGKHDAAGQPAPASLRPGQALPMPEGLRTLDGNAFGSAELHGHDTLLSFYFAECLPCIAEVPELNRLAQSRPGMRVYGVTFDDAGTAAAFVAQRGLEVPVVADAKPYLDALGVKTYPTLALVDAQGRIVAVRHGGAMTIPRDAPATGQEAAGAGPDDPDSGAIARWVAASLSQAAPATP